MSPSDDFSSNRTPSGIFEKKDKEKVEQVNLVIDVIREHSPISIWDLAKKLNISHSKLYYLLRDLEFAGVIFSKVKLNENNHSARMIYISRSKEAKKDE